MKKESRYFPEMTRWEIEEFLKTGSKVIVPVGSTEQHGPHLTVWANVLIPLEIAKRVAREVEALVAPPIHFALSADHRTAGGVIYLRHSTFADVVGDVAFALAEQGFREIIFLNGHWSNQYAIHYALSSVKDRLPGGTIAFGIGYWVGTPEQELEQYLSVAAGMHANVGETSAVMAIDPDLVDLEKAPNEWPEFPEYRTSMMTILDSYMLGNPGCFLNFTESGAWGDATQSTAEKGEVYLQQATEGTINVIRDVEDTYAHFSKK